MMSTTHMNKTLITSDAVECVTLYSFEQRNKALQFVHRIKNDNKREYADTYLGAKFRGQPTNQIKEKCSYMAAQGVRMQLADILGE